jgi:hypothetical protein
MIGVQRSDSALGFICRLVSRSQACEVHLVALRQDRLITVSGCARRYLRDCTSPGGLCTELGIGIGTKLLSVSRAARTLSVQ